jgi:hypothetical protein
VLAKPLGSVRAAVIVLLGSIADPVTRATGSVLSSRAAFGIGSGTGMAVGGWDDEIGMEVSVAVRVGVGLVVVSVLGGARLVVVIWVAGGAGGLGAVRGWAAGGRAATREEMSHKAKAIWGRRMGAVIVGLLKEEERLGRERIKS